MAIIKTLLCAALFLVQVANADFYVNCMAAPDATPFAAECTADVQEEVLTMLDGCTDLDMGYAELGARRQLRSGEQAQQSKRELQWGFLDGYCYGMGLSGGARMMCCMQTGNHYSYCGSPMGGRKLQAAGYYNETELTGIASECTAAFQGLATETEGGCYGSADDVFCETIQILMG
jgi:hypothetical protein